ncbi:helix-turn-helix domain-containing protein [Persicitalea jodogahamensis]|uniref:Uncharacterized protein n=1 Tax=Persicitalea jodogahamensis TaxID=402147 RepID=A0A8J3D7J7_9BACT|nr:helix-turn-helix domain-containing protein [Persicitalea jodogahamensis]GHB62973.1 hypothetical protein GCM10007390_16010 [Persicitalea jodogahamensis]
MRTKYKLFDCEAFCKRSVELKDADWRQKDISVALGLAEGWVSQTLRKYWDLGAQGLVARKTTGAPPRLTADQLERLMEELEFGAQHHGFGGEV